MWCCRYLDYENGQCRKSLVDKLVEECHENIDEKELHPTELHSSKMIYNSILNDYEKICSSCKHSSCTTYIVLFIIFFKLSIGISSVFIYFNWYLKRKHIERTIYWRQLCWTYKWEILSKSTLKSIHVTFLIAWSI